MTEKQNKMMEMAGISENDFKPKTSDKERIAELEAQNEMLTECIIEMANIIYA